MGEVIQLFKKKAKQEYDDRMKRIKDSLERINKLMEQASKEKQDD